MKTEELGRAIEDWKYYMIEEDLAERSIITYTTALYQLWEFLKSSGYEELTRGSLIDYKSYLNQKRTAGEIKVATVNTRILGIDRFLSDMECGLGDFKLKTERVQQTFMNNDLITPEEFKCMIEKARELGLYRESLILKVLGMTGIRVGELSFFTVEAVREALKTLSITVVNKKKERVIIVPKELSKELLAWAYMNRIESGILFPNKTETGVVDRTWISRNFEKVAKACGINKPCNPHQFRHLFAQTYIDKFKDPIALADLLGHSSLTTTRRYLHKSIKENSRAISSLYSER